MLDFFTLLSMLIMVFVILYSSVVFTKYLGNKTISSRGFTKNMKIVEMLPVSQEKSVAVVEVVGKYYMLGISNNNINLIKELDEFPIDIKEDESNSFQQTMQDVLLKYKKK